MVQPKKVCNAEATPWMSELWEVGVGTTTRAEDTTKEMVCRLLASKVKARAKEKETAIIADRRDTFPESAPINVKAKAKQRIQRRKLQLR